MSENAFSEAAVNASASVVETLRKSPARTVVPTTDALSAVRNAVTCVATVLLPSAVSALARIWSWVP